MAFDMLAAMGKRTAAVVPSIVMIDVDNLVPNKKNFYRVTGDPEIEKQNEQLKATIEIYGVKQPLLVKAKENGKYSITAGERRYLACRRLVDEGKTEYKILPCIVEKPLSAEDEQIELIITNHHRDKNLSEKIEEVHQLSELLQKKKDRGEKIPGRLQDIIAECLNISKSEVGRLQQIDNNLQPELKEAIKKKELAMTPAVELSKLSPEDQKAVYEETGGKVTAKEVKKYQQQEETETPREPENMNIEGFEPSKPALTEEKPQSAVDVVSTEYIKAARTTETHLERELEKYRKALEIARKKGNSQKEKELKALIKYVGISLIPKVKDDLFRMKGKDMFHK
ncbi:ParB family chromosome partitioning protein [Sporomusaceae bacterium BoRhaA]|uniref:ParB/RepB/Spo0J family partition protein n=1 Tax=Pelorhabdus rhamnosifermentans TaxID=2772457 RepID=UPI001C060395|nr:ParB N-terminal domain-containing protein [Pelorhabdus rhamnosifermentans]MBU2701670.1 ParB family chromosome partitioning protein [Pelorhabdus rhamnosifermentans]